MNILNKVTLKYLYKNKVRTMVTIIGILLSAAMFTAVTTSISSFQNYLVKTITEVEGTWQAAAYDLSFAEQQEFCEKEELTDSLVLAHQGFLEISSCLKNGTEPMQSQNSGKPYILLGTWMETDSDLIRIDLTDGRMPENAYEILVPKHLVTNGGVLLSLGDTITGALGKRSYEGRELHARDGYYRYETDEEGNILPDSTAETFALTGEEKTYTIVGFYERADVCVEKHFCPGYLVLTGAMDAPMQEQASYQVYYTVKRVTEIFDFIEAQSYDYDYHSDLLRAYGTSRDSYQTIFWGLGAVLAVIILFGSVALIYNAFSISVNERVKQFGLLSSIGATKRQLRRSVLFEAVCVSAIGIPFGVLAGIAGMAITFYCLQDSFAGLVWGGNAKLTICVEPWAVVAAMLLSFVTVLVSAWLPARRTLKISAIEAIRQNSEIKCSRRRVRTFGVVYRLFGLEGMLANKNFKRNKRKYRATVLSLFVSIVLFVSASSFVTYLKNSVAGVVIVNNYDYAFTMFEGEHVSVTAEELQQELTALPEVEKVSAQRLLYRSMAAESELLTAEYREYISQNHAALIEEAAHEGDAKLTLDVNFVFLSDEEYRAYLSEQGLGSVGYFEQGGEALVFDGIRVIAAEKYQTIEYLSQKLGTLTLSEFDYRYQPVEQEDGSMESEWEREWIRDWKLAYRVLDTELPFGVAESNLTFVYPVSASKELGIDLTEQPVYLYLKAAEPGAFDKVQKVLFANGLDDDRLIDVTEGQNLERNLIVIVNVFSYGFIILISLIAAANVFNTISTGISLRNREFAMLESVGMTKKSFYKMLNYECLLYGVKSILYGVPVSVLVTWWIYKIISNGYTASFYMPVTGVLIAVVSVFLVVFATMFYAAAKVRRHSVIETLKNENV